MMRAASLRRLSPLLLLAAALIALAVFFVHDARPASADHDTSVKELWSATLTVSVLGSDGNGCDVLHQTTSKRCNQAARLTDNSFSYLGHSFAVNKIAVDSDGHLTFRVDTTTSEKFRSDLTLHVGSRQFPLADATASTHLVANDTFTWRNTGLSWPGSSMVQLKITRPTFTGVELFGGDLDTSNPDRAPTLSVAEGGSATFMVKLSEQPNANVTVSLGKGTVSCAGCGGNWHDDVNAGTVSPTTLTFTTSNWNAGQTVTVTGVADDDSVHEHFLALVYVSSTTSTSPGDPFRSPEASLGVYVTVTDGSDDGSQPVPHESPVNHMPTVASPIADVDDLAVGDTRQVSLSGVFNYDGHGGLTIRAGSYDNDVARVSAAADGSSLTLSGESAGTTTIWVSAQDHDGDWAVDRFEATVTETGSNQQQQVNHSPTVASPISDVSALEEGSDQLVPLSGVFAYEGPGALTILARSANDDVATVTANSSSLTVTGVAEGTTTISVIAEDPDGDRATDEFSVTVTAAPVQQNNPPQEQQQVSGPPAVQNLTCVATTEQVRFRWDIPSWADGETKWYDLDITLPNGRNVFQRQHWQMRSRTEKGNWRPATQASISVVALYDLPDGERVKSVASETSCVVPGTPNAVPTVSSGIADATITDVSGTHQASLSGVFSDSDGDDLTITAASSDEGVATVAVANDSLTVTAKARGSATITVTAADGNGGSVNDTFDVAVKAVPAVASAIDDITGLEINDRRKVSVNGVFSDPDGDAVMVTGATTSDRAVVSVSVALHPTTSAVTGLTIMANAEGTATITVAAQDSDGNTVSDAFDVTVNAEQQQLQKKNSVPVVANAISDATIVNETGTKQVALSAVFSDGDGDGLTLKAASSAESVATVEVANGSLTVTAKARGSATITVTAADGNGGSVEDAFTVTVKAAPTVAAAIPDATMVEVSSQDVDLSKVFSDADGDTLTYTVSSTDLDAVAVFEFLSVMTVFAIKKSEETITVTAQDSDGNEVSDSFTVTVTAPANNPPTVANAISDATIVNETGTDRIALSGVFSDADGDALTITAASSADGVAAVSVAADQSALTVTAKARGTATITVTASDGNGGSVEDSFSVTVKAAPMVAAPVDDVSELEVDATQEVALSDVFTDADGDAMTVTAASSDEGKATVSVAADQSALTVSGVSEGTATITVTAEDADGNQVSDAFDVTVTENTSSQFHDGEAAPGPVTDLQLTAEGGSLIVSWSPPAPDSGGEVRGYIVHLKPEGGGKGRTKTPKAKKTKVSFENLEAGRTYKVWVRAENAAGKGERVHASITLP